LASIWVARIGAFGEYLSLAGGHRKPMAFHSPMPRDSCTVELRLAGLLLMLTFRLARVHAPRVEFVIHDRGQFVVTCGLCLQEATSQLKKFPFLAFAFTCGCALTAITRVSYCFPLLIFR
jgi:hypothetical protein